MTDIETLLSVDAGKIPPGIVVFREDNPERGETRLRLVLSAVTLATAMACAYGGAGRFLVALLVLAATGLAVLATPTSADESAPKIKRQVMIVTPDGIIMRDDHGLRAWSFDDLTSVQAAGHQGHPFLILVDRNGNRHAIEHTRFERAERLGEVLGQRVRPGPAGAA